MLNIDFDGLSRIIVESVVGSSKKIAKEERCDDIAVDTMAQWH
jgi:hypothetical protein